MGRVATYWRTRVALRNRICSRPDQKFAKHRNLASVTQNIGPSVHRAFRLAPPHRRHNTLSIHHERLQGVRERGGARPSYRALESVGAAERASAGVLSSDFVGLVPAYSDTHEPVHKQRRGA
eukprot:CAMPEP_0182533720 /NCGR_PEP_ID=MMETSP1323-20130603/14233_1 /TAXON_ID=236787 /ORGANISM="Florenciella parvula, Strain RCC1693" /LENGTH=121 /DNA_ID=CAMNT_0024743639 /DNA_START=88 /DNA_END=449 /DNA_ORIENTATION=-